jgi:hypothetical protein
MIFNGVVSSTVQNLCNVSPFVVKLPVHQIENPFLFSTPIDLFYSWVQMIVPTLSTLLAHAAR